jgi:excisionase family DNA binding protein
MGIGRERGRLMARTKKMPVVSKQLLLSVQDVAVLMGVCRQTVYTLIYREGLPSIQVRGMRRIHPESLDGWLRAREK